MRLSSISPLLNLTFACLNLTFACLTLTISASYRKTDAKFGINMSENSRKPIRGPVNRWHGPVKCKPLNRKSANKLMDTCQQKFLLRFFRMLIYFWDSYFLGRLNCNIPYIYSAQISNTPLHRRISFYNSTFQVRKKTERNTMSEPPTKIILSDKFMQVFRSYLPY